MSVGTEVTSVEASFDLERACRVVVQDDGQSLRVLVFASSGLWLAEAEVSARQALRLAQELLDAGLQHLGPAL